MKFIISSSETVCVVTREKWTMSILDQFSLEGRIALMTGEAGPQMRVMLQCYGNESSGGRPLDHPSKWFGN